MKAQRLFTILCVLIYITLIALYLNFRRNLAKERDEACDNNVPCINICPDSEYKYTNEEVIELLSKDEHNFKQWHNVTYIRKALNCRAYDYQMNLHGIDIWFDSVSAHAIMQHTITIHTVHFFFKITADIVYDHSTHTPLSYCLEPTKDLSTLTLWLCFEELLVTFHYICEHRYSVFAL
jgi:hypothetical protein